MVEDTTDETEAVTDDESGEITGDEAEEDMEFEFTYQPPPGTPGSEIRMWSSEFVGRATEIDGGVDIGLTATMTDDMSEGGYVEYEFEEPIRTVRITMVEPDERE